MEKTHAQTQVKKIQKTIDRLEIKANMQESEGITRPERLAVIGQIYQERAKLARLDRT